MRGILRIFIYYCIYYNMFCFLLLILYFILYSNIVFVRRSALSSRHLAPTLLGCQANLDLHLMSFFPILISSSSLFTCSTTSSSSLSCSSLLLLLRGPSLISASICFPLYTFPNCLFPSSFACWKSEAESFTCSSFTSTSSGTASTWAAMATSSAIPRWLMYSFSSQSSFSLASSCKSYALT